MKRLMLFAALALFMASCVKDDDCPKAVVDANALITPKLYATVENSSNTQSPMTGILTVAPCQPNSAIYFGNYVEGKLTPFDGYYNVKNGDFYQEAINREISLPAGPYNMVYWGTPKYETPIYANPAVRDPVYVIGQDMSRQTFSMFRMSKDTTYYPVFDMVYAVKATNIGTENLSAALKRTVAGLKVIVKDRDNGIHQRKYRQHVCTRHRHLHRTEFLHLRSPVPTTGTVAFPLIRSTDGTQMSNATVMLFPYIGKPVFKLFILLKNGTLKSFQQSLETPMTANTKLTLTLTLGDIFSEESSGVSPLKIGMNRLRPSTSRVWIDPPTGKTSPTRVKSLSCCYK